MVYKGASVLWDYDASRSPLPYSTSADTAAITQFNGCAPSAFDQLPLVAGMDE